MKTNTRSLILKLIQDAGQIRPVALRLAVSISAQALHRHLRALTEAGIIEMRGSPPFTQYAMAGNPDLLSVKTWLTSTPKGHSSEAQVCETRDEFTGRLPRFKAYVTNGLPEKLLPLVISTVGEIGNNSFDHNIGQWKDTPGCWLESQVTGRQLWICIADRGQGIFRSLSKVHPHLTDEQATLHAAFETVISGRAPERRGNGLKFVKANLSATSGAGIGCMSGKATVFYGDQGEKCQTLLRQLFTEVKGTITLMVWRFA